MAEVRAVSETDPPAGRRRDKNKIGPVVPGRDQIATHYRRARCHARSPIVSADRDRPWDWSDGVWRTGSEWTKVEIESVGDF